VIHAKAEARRKESAAAFLERHAQVIVKSERALALYAAELEEWLRPNPRANSKRLNCKAAIRVGADN
jgi:hypothetical protein